MAETIVPSALIPTGGTNQHLIHWIYLIKHRFWIKWFIRHTPAYNCCFKFVDFFFFFRVFCFTSFFRVHISRLSIYIYFFFLAFLFAHHNLAHSQIRELNVAATVYKRHVVLRWNANFKSLINESSSVDVFACALVTRWYRYCSCYRHSFWLMKVISFEMIKFSLNQSSNISSHYLICTKSNFVPFHWESKHFFHSHKQIVNSMFIYWFDLMFWWIGAILSFVHLFEACFFLNIDYLILIVWMIVCLMKWMPLHWRCATML